MKKRAVVWSKFGGSYEVFDELIKSQGNKCDLCGISFSEKIKPQFDHDHGRMIPRGILCIRCNTNLPYIEDKEFIKKAQLYLKKHSETKDKEPL